MERVYNDKISQRANECLARRACKVRAEKRMIVIIGIIVVSLLILLGSSISAFASSRSPKTLHKYYTSIQIEQGDTLWTLADDYIIDGVMSKEEFIDEVCQINRISENDILHSGRSIVVAYYSAEEL